MVKYCSNCGNKLEDTDEICGKCGTHSPDKPKVSKLISNTESKFNKKIILAIVGIVVIIGIVVVAGGFSDSETTYEFNDFTLTLPSNYVVESPNPMSVRVYDENNMLIGTVETSGVLLNGNKEVTLGGHNGVINENVGTFAFEENGHRFLITDGQEYTGSYENIEVIAEGLKVKAANSQPTNSTNSNEQTYNCKVNGVNFVIPSEGHNRDGVAIRFTYEGKNCEIEEVPSYEESTDTKTFYEASFSQYYQGGEPYTLVVNNHPWTGVKIYKDGKWFHISMNTDDCSEAEKLVSWMSDHNSWTGP